MAMTLVPRLSLIPGPLAGKAEPKAAAEDARRDRNSYTNLTVSEKFAVVHAISQAVIAGRKPTIREEEALTDALFHTCALDDFANRSPADMERIIGSFMDLGAKPLSARGRPLEEVFRDEGQVAVPVNGKFEMRDNEIALRVLTGLVGRRRF